MKRRVVVAGLGRLGLRVVEHLLDLGAEVVLVDLAPRPELLRQIEGRLAKLILGDAREPSILQAAGLPGVAAVVACTESEVDNLAVALAADALQPGLRVVLHLFWEGPLMEVARKLPNCVALDAAALVAPNFLYGALVPRVRYVVDTPGERYLLLPAGVGPEAPPYPKSWRLRGRGPQSPGAWLVAARVCAQEHHLGRSTGSKRHEFSRRQRYKNFVKGVMESPTLPVLALLIFMVLTATYYFEQKLHLDPVSALYFVVTVLTTTGFGDISPAQAGVEVKLATIGLMLGGTVVMGTTFAFMTDALLSFRLGRLLRRQRLPKRDHVVVVGLGRVGYRVQEEVRTLGLRGVGVERLGEHPLATLAHQQGFPVVQKQDTVAALDDVHAEHARALLALTDDDRLNLDLALHFRERNPNGKVALRLFDPHVMELLRQRLHFDRVDGLSVNTSPAFALAALGPQSLCDAFMVEDELWGVAVWLWAEAASQREPRVWAEARVKAIARQRQDGDWVELYHWPSDLAPGDRLVLVAPQAFWLELEPEFHSAIQGQSSTGARSQELGAYRPGTAPLSL